MNPDVDVHVPVLPLVLELVERGHLRLACEVLTPVVARALTR